MAAKTMPTGQLSSTGRPRPPMLPAFEGLFASIAATAGSNSIRVTT